MAYEAMQQSLVQNHCSFRSVCCQQWPALHGAVGNSTGSEPGFQSQLCTSRLGDLRQVTQPLSASVSSHVKQVIMAPQSFGSTFRDYPGKGLSPDTGKAIATLTKLKASQRKCVDGEGQGPHSERVTRELRFHREVGSW